MILAPDVTKDPTHPAIWYALGVADEIHKEMFSVDLFVTCMVGTRGYNSYHVLAYSKDKLCRAFDARMKHHKPEDRSQFRHRLYARLQPQGFDILLEPDDLTDEKLAKQGRKREDVIPHLHVELDYGKPWPPG